MNQVTAQAMRKGELIKLLKKFSERTVRNEMLSVIQERRSVPIKEARDIKVLYPSEVKAVLERFE
jgi:exopolyphosphatase/pppGpp-phosphohydrolase